MLPKFDSQHVTEPDLGPILTDAVIDIFCTLWRFLLKWKPSMGHPVYESLSPNEYTAKPRQGFHKYFWNLSRNLNESQWLLGICFLQTCLSWLENLWIIWLCVETLLSKRVSKLSLTCFQGSFSLRPCTRYSFCSSSCGRSLHHLGSALMPVTSNERTSLTMPRRSNTS